MINATPGFMSLGSQPGDPFEGRRKTGNETNAIGLIRRALRSDHHPVEHGEIGEFERRQQRLERQPLHAHALDLAKRLLRDLTRYCSSTVVPIHAVGGSCRLA